MAGYRSVALAFLLCSLNVNVQAFTVNTPFQSTKNNLSVIKNNNRNEDTRLHIIGPIIRKMREANAEKNRPLASDEERESEAPGLKVGTGVWKWPPVWPYAPDFFLRVKEEELEKSNQNNPMSSALLGMGGGGVNGATPPGVMDAETLKKKEEEARLDPMKFWGEEKKDVLTELDEEAVEKLKK